MIKKSELRSEFERIVTSVKSVFTSDFERVSVVDFQLEIVSCGRSYVIELVGYAEYPRGHEVLARSYPFHSYKSAYQTLVRL